MVGAPTLVPVSVSDRPGAALAIVLDALVCATPSSLYCASPAFWTIVVVFVVLAGSKAKEASDDVPEDVSVVEGVMVKALLAPSLPLITSCEPVAPVAT